MVDTKQIFTDSLDAFEMKLSVDIDNEVTGSNDQEKGSVRVVSGSGFRYVVPFPWRLHEMLQDIERSGEDSIVSWLPDGNHFQVHNPQLFIQRVIPRFFKQKSYKSFQRQLHLYGFQRILEGLNRGAYYHENFVRENRKLALDITRIKAPKRRRMKPLSSKASLDSPSGTVGNTASIGLIQDSRDFSSNCHSSDTGLNVTREGGLSQSQPIAVALTNLSCDPSPSSVHPRETSVADTYEWLISAGVPFSAFDPIAIETYFPNDLLSKNTFSDLIDCADEITSLFSSPSCEVPSSQTVAISFVSRDDSLQSLNTITGSIENSCVY